ncbi:VC0807 family protein [Amycolatopsis nivea]
MTGKSGVRDSLKRLPLLEILAPLVLFYGLRWLGVNQFVALLAGSAIPVVGAVRGLVAERRISGVRLFVLGTMAVTVAGSFVTGSPRALLLRSAVLTVALGFFLLATLFFRRPFLYEAARVVFDEDKQRAWRRSWDDFPPFRQLLWRISLIWGLACLADAAIRIAMALLLPVDVVPALDDGLLVVTLLVLVVVQRFYGRSFLRRNGLRLHGARVAPLAEA